MRSLTGRLWAKVRIFVRAMLVVAATPRETLATVTSRNIRRLAYRYWRLRVGATVVDLVVVIVLAVLIPWALVPIGIVVGVSAFRHSRRARTDWGAEAGLPPGRVSVGSRPLHDPDFLLKSAEKFGPVFKSNHFDGPQVCVVGMERATEFLTNNEDTLSTVPVGFNKFIPESFVRWQRGEGHEDFRRLFGHALGLPLIRARAPTIENSIDRCHSRATDRQGVLVKPWVREFVHELWFDLFYGIERNDRRAKELAELYPQIGVGSPARPRVALPALERIEELVGAGPTEPGTTTIVSLLHSRRNTEQLGSAELRNAIFMFATSFRDMTGLIVWSVKHGADHPRLMEQLRYEDRSTATDFDPHSLANRMISETLRMEQSEHLFRRPQVDLELGGYRVPAQWLVRICTHESHRDPNVFSDPDRYDPDRFVGPGSFGAAYSPFGVGGRSCVGETLTRRLGATFISRLAHGFDLSVIDDGPRTMGHDEHWNPSDRFRIRLDPVD